MQNGECGFVIADQDCFSDLQFQPACRKTGCSKRCQDLQRQGAALELNR
jgi:hypothetical protein